jgi:hypothetical protein
MTETNKLTIQNFIETQIPEFLNEDNPLFKEFLEQYYISIEHQTGSVDLANNLLEYKSIENFNNETFYTQLNPCILTEDFQIFNTTLNVNHTIGFPTKYGILKIDNEIITYISKTETSFVGCVRGFSGIDDISNKNLYSEFNFKSSESEFHSTNSTVENLNIKFFEELFRKFKYQFIPGFENRKFADDIDLQSILFRAKDFYTTKGTDTSYKILFKILFNEEINVIKPQDYMLRPSDNKYFITHNILVEKISGELDPLLLKGETIYQNTPNGTASASVYNVEVRPLDNSILYELSLDPSTITLNFVSTKKTKLQEDVDINENIITVDSTFGFPEVGSVLVQLENSNTPIELRYSGKTINQFLNVSGNTIKLSKNTPVIETNFAYSSILENSIQLRILNIIDDIDYSATSSLRVGDIINLSSFGLELNDRPEFNSWVYNIPTTHKIKSISSTAEPDVWRIELYDGVKFTNEEKILFGSLNNTELIPVQANIRTIINTNTIEVSVSGSDIVNKDILIKILTKSDVFNYPEVNNITSNIQNTYVDNNLDNFYVASSGLPDYRILADDRKILISTPNISNPFSGVGGTTLLNTNKEHKFYTGEKVYFTPTGNTGLSTGVYFVFNVGNFEDSRKISFSYSNSDLFSKKYIELPYGSSGEIVKSDYENKKISHQKLLRKFSLNKSKSKIKGSKITNNKPIGLLVNGVELYSSTLYDENLYYGKISSIQITNNGNEYDIINSPELEVVDIVNNVGYGFGAKAHLNLIGSVKGIQIVNPGSGYNSNVTISIRGGNGVGAAIEANVDKTRIVSGFRGDGTGINPTDNSIKFVFPHNFEDGEIVEYLSNNNTEIEYFDPVSQEIRTLPSKSFYFAGVISDTIIKLYRTKDNAAKKINEIDLTTSPSFGLHYFRSVVSKYSLVNVYIKDRGYGYSNKKITIPAISDDANQTNGVNIVDNYIFAKNHNFKEKDLVTYHTTGNSIAGLSTENTYYIHIIDENKFNLSTVEENTEIVDDNYINQRYVRLNSLGTGKHTFAYPPITLEVEAYPESANGKLTLPILEPVVVGEVESIFIEENGERYGDSNIINFHRRPIVRIKPIQSECLLKPVIVNGAIIEVQILNFGNGYGKDIDLVISGKGNFANLYPVVVNGKITSIIILNKGIGYDEATTISVKRRGSNAKFLANIFEWKINQVEKNKSLLTGIDEGILAPSRNEQNSLQFINFYPPKSLRKKLNDNIDVENKEQLPPVRSPILGWSYDGFPIYGPYTIVDNQIQLIRSSYRKLVERNSNLRPTGNVFPDGFFIQDYIFNINSGDGLDEYNGKFIQNSDFPEGNYAYFFTISIDNNRISKPEYPYVIAKEFNRYPSLENYDPNFNQNSDLAELNLVRNTSPYYLNSQSSFYELIDDVNEKYKQEFNIRTISSSGITSLDIYDPGDKYKVGDGIRFSNRGFNGTGANAIVSAIVGKPISSINVGVSTIYPTYFSKSGNIVVGISNTPLEFIDGETINIDNISDPQYKFLEGSKQVTLVGNSVGLTTTILNIAQTGNITKIYTNDISGFEVGDYLKIDTEIVKILEISENRSEFTIERLSNPGIHTSGISKVILLPRKFIFFDSSSKLNLLENKIVYFDPEDVVSEGESAKQYSNNGITTITIPEKSIYIPNHSYFTGQPLTYNSGVNGTPLLVYNFPGESSFQLSDNQTIYAINVGRDFLGISTLGFSTNIGIGTTNLSLYFDPSISGVGAAHSFTTQYYTVTGNVENYSVTIATEVSHNLVTEDVINLNIVPEIVETIIFRYDPIIKKITTEKILFNASAVDVENSEILIESKNFNTGDKIVYYSESGTVIGGLVDNTTYFIIKDAPGKIKLANYYSDAISGAFITLDLVGSGVQSISKINPEIKITKGNTVKFDTTDDSIDGLTLRLFKDSEFKVELETYNYISNTGERYIKTDLDQYPKEIYYSFSSSTTSIFPDYEVKNNNFISIVNSDYNTDYDIIKLDDTRFKINLNGRPENLEYNTGILKEFKYSTKSKNSNGPISKIQVNYGGKTYNIVPKVVDIISNDGRGALVKAKSEKIGRISSLERVKDGFDYPTDPTLLPLLSVPAVVQVEDISRVDYIGITTGGKNYNSAPTLKVIGNDRIKLQAIIQGSSVVDVKIIENTDDLSGPLRIAPIQNSNGYSIDDIEVVENQVTLELVNTDIQLYPLITSGYGSTDVVFPFKLGDQIFIERCRIVLSERDQNGTLIPKDNFNSSNYNYRFFTVTGINTENYTVTYSMEGVKDNLNLGEYTSDFGFGYVVNRADIAEFEMFTANDLNYFSNETVLGFNEKGTNTFSAKVMKNGWDNDINELRLINVTGELKVGDKLRGNISLLNGTVTNVNTFNLKTKLGVTRDKLNDLGDRVGFTNDYYQRISDNIYYQKFSYSIKGKIPYNVWKEPIKSLIHPSGFKEFSDLSVESSTSASMRVGTASSLELTVNIDNTQSLYKKNNFAMVTEDEQFEDGSIERIIFEEGVALRSYILSKSNKVADIDDISSQFNGTAILEVIANKDVTFISTDIYRLGVSTEGLNVGDKIGFSTYHFYPDSTYIFEIQNNFIELSSDTPHRLYSNTGISTSIVQNLNFFRRVPGSIAIGNASFKLKHKGVPLFYREFDASNGITTAINLDNSAFLFNTHNFQTGQKLIYTPELQEPIAIAVTTIGSGAILKPVFDANNYSILRIKVLDGGSGYDPINLPKIEITGTQNPLSIGTFIPSIEPITGIITSIQIGTGNSGFGYFPISSGTIGIVTTSEIEGRKDIILEVGGGIGSAIYERGYNVAIATSIIGISSNITPNFSGQQNRFWGFIDPYIPAKETTGSGIDSKFSIFIVYDSSTGQPISTSVVLRDGGRGYSIGDGVSIAGTFMGGQTPENDLSFIVSKVSSTRISLEADNNYNNIPVETSVGYGSGAILNVERNGLGDIANVSIVNGGKNYDLTDNITIAGTYIGGITPEDNLFLSPTILGIDVLPTNLYVEKITNNSFRVSGTPDGNTLEFTSLGIGTHTLILDNQNVNSIITIDNIIQSPIYKKILILSLSKEVKFNDSIIYLQSDANELMLNDIIQINEEYIKIKNIGVDGENSLLVERGTLGTSKDVHDISDSVYVVSGNYNIIRDDIHFSSPPYGPTGISGLEVNSSFSGRSFSRRVDPFVPNDVNIIFDDISNQFTGIAATEFILKSDGNAVSGIFTDTNSITGSSSGVEINNNPIILINNIPQIGGMDYTIDTPGENTIRFISGVPLAGKITVVGINTGFGYLPLVGASATVSVSQLGVIENIFLTGFGKGYREAPIVTIASTVGFGASIVANIGVAGTVTSLTIIGSGSGYSTTILPEVRIDLPQNYYNLDLVYANGYSGVGQGAKGSVIVGNGSSVISFTLDNSGTSYKVGDVLVASGIVTDSTASYFEEFKVTVLETFTDSFNGWYPGQFIQFDDISTSFNGSRKKFTLTVTISGNKEVLSLRTLDPEDISITNNMFVYINDILQVPNESYSFTGSRLVFKEAPKAGSKCDLLFFRGSDLDVEQIDPPKTIKEGDEVQIDENIFDPYDRPQFERVVKNIVSTDILDTFPYDSIGILTDPEKIRPLHWTKQTVDKIMNGVLYSKSRPDLKSKITPTASVIKDISKRDLQLYVDSAIPLFEDIDENRGLSEDLRDIIIVNNREITSPIVEAIVSSGSTISSINIIEPGSGYRNITSPSVSISPNFITRKDPIFNWNSNVGIGTSLNFNSVGYGTGFIAVGEDGQYALSIDGEEWKLGNKININYDFNDVIGYENSYVAIGNSGNVYNSVGLTTTIIWKKVTLLRSTQDVLGRPNITLSEYSGNFNDATFNIIKNTIVVVGNNGVVFSGVGIGTTDIYENTVGVTNINSVTSNTEYFVAVGNSGDIIYSQTGSNWERVRVKKTQVNLNDIIWDGEQFVTVGNNKTIMTSIDGISWNLISTNLASIDILKINYNNNLYTILDEIGKLYFSINISDWTKRVVDDTYRLLDIISIGNDDNDEKYVSVGTSGYISYSTPVLNRAIAISTSLNDTLEEITIINGGFGYSSTIKTPVIVETDTCEKEQVFSIKSKGDFGTITNVNVFATGNLGFGTTSPAIVFTLKSENSTGEILPNMQYTPLSIGDYFVISDSNVICGHALTGITTSLGGMSNYPTSKVGTATTFIDGIYRVESVTDSSLGISTVRCIFAPVPNVGADNIIINVGLNTTGFYGRYSFGILYDYQNRARENPKSFKVNVDNGLVGLETGPIIFRTRSVN